MKRTLRFLPAALVLVMLAAPLPASKPDFLNSVRPLQALLPVIVSTEEAPDYQTGTEALRNICTTTSINAHYWLTAAHCVADLEKKEVDSHLRYIDGHQADIAALSYDGDMAVLVTHDYAIPSVKFADKAPTWLDPLLIAGHPYGYDALFLTKGTVANPFAKLDDGYYMILNVAAAPGNSGSCVFNLKGEVVSILQVGWGRGFSPVTGGAPYWHLRQFALKYFGQ